MKDLLLIVLLSLMISISLNTARSEDTAIEKTKELAVTIKKDVKKIKTGKTQQLDVGPRPLKLATIDIIGVADELKKNIVLHMAVTIPECNADRSDVKLFFNTVKNSLRKATRALGYYDAEFTSGGSIVNKCWKLRLKVTPGRPTKVISQEIKVIGSGQNDEVFKKILKDLPYKIGDVLTHQHYSDFKTKLSEASQTFGYFDAQFERHFIRIDPASYQARVALVLNTGSRYFYGDVTVEQKTLSNKAVNKYLIITTGQPFRSEDLIKQQQILQRSGYYKTIKIEVLHEKIANNRVPVSIVLTPKKRNAYKFKVGFGSDTGARVSAELDRRWTGVKGRQLQIKAQYAQTLSGVSLRLLNPRQKPEENSLVHNIDWIKDSNDDVTGRSVNIGSTLIGRRSNDWIRSVHTNVLLDRTQVEGEAQTRSKLLLFGVGLEKVSADNLIFPTDGWRIKLALDTASEFVLSDQNLIQFTARAKRIIQFGSGRLLGRVNYGTTLVNDFERLPKSLRFFAGGGNSVRGYDFESLGELNTNNRNRGGKQLIDASLEYQHSINKSWGLAVFADAGNAFDDFEDADLEVGLGFGARWRSPVGPVRIDLGFPKDDFSQPKLYLSVGADL